MGATGNVIFPNEAHVAWTVMVVLYPFLTGLVDGAYFVSTLHYVFGRRELEPVARLSLVASFVLLLFSPLPLLMHLGRPERAYQIFVTPTSSSVLSGFGLIYTLFFVLVALQLWFVSRSRWLRWARGGAGLRRWLSRAVLLFDVSDTSATRVADVRMTRALGVINIPVAFMLHGYVGFLFGSLKANPWWSNSMMFIIFIVSAVVSGLAMLLVQYMTSCRLEKTPVDQRCVRALSVTMWGFAIGAVALELAELLSMAYKAEADWQIVRRLVGGPLFGSYVVGQFVICSLVPLVLLGVVALAKPRARLSNALSYVSALLLLLQVFLMRWNTVVGGQLLSKSGRGLSSYAPPWLGRESVLSALVLVVAPLALLYVLHRAFGLLPRAAVPPTALPSPPSDSSPGSSPESTE